MQKEAITKMKITVQRVSATTMLFASILCAGGFWSCSKESLEKNEDLHRVEINPGIVMQQGSVNDQRSTKAVVDDKTDLTLYFVRADEVELGTYGNYATTALLANRTAGTGAKNLTFETVQYYQRNGLKTKLTGWYPAATSFVGGIVSWTFDGSQDIITAAQQEGSATTPMPNISFNHRLSQLQFCPYAETQHIANNWGKILSIEVLNQQNEALYTLATDDGTITFGASAASTFSAGIPAAGVAITVSTAASKESNATQVGNSVMIAPQNSDNYTLTLRVQTEKQGTKTVTLTKKFLAGTSYKIYLRFTQIEMIISPEIEIGDWVPGYNASVNTDPVTDPDIDIGDWGPSTDHGVDY